MEQLTTATLTQLPQVRALGRHTGRDPLTLFWTASGMELEFTGSELWVDLFADYETVEPWVSVELNGAWVARFTVNPGKSRVCLFRGMTPGKAKHLRLLKDVQAMHDDPAHLLQITGLEYAGGEFLPLPEPQYRLEFVGDSITSGEGAIGAKPEEDWVGAFFSAENHYGRLTADALGAEYRCISQSGWGLVTGWDNDVRHVMPPYYTQVCGVAMGQRNAALGAQQDNDFAAWKPDAVIVNLARPCHRQDPPAAAALQWGLPPCGRPKSGKWCTAFPDPAPGKEPRGKAGVVHRDAGQRAAAGIAAGHGAVQGHYRRQLCLSAGAAQHHAGNRGCPAAPRRREPPAGGKGSDRLSENDPVKMKTGCRSVRRRSGIPNIIYIFH